MILTLGIVAASASAHPPEHHAGPHGGQVAATRSYFLEAVYLPTQTRLYLYDRSGRPLDVATAHGDVAMLVRSNLREFRYGLAPVTGVQGVQSYLKAGVDVSRVRDGDMTITFSLTDLPDRAEPAVRIQQTFAITPFRPDIVVAQVTERDRDAIGRQKTCPIMGETLGQHGEVVKVLVDGLPVYLCCEGCVDKVKQDPLAVLTALGGSAEKQKEAADGKITVAQATAADREAMAAQGNCPVMGKPLGAHGTPWKVTIGERSLFVCCKGCIARVQRDPETYFAKVSRSAP
ncbi:MAG: hypothetical protein HYS13_05175 [Planctomycetia bacterium]|nr:hypothetical protein [Planctomycetia bacterium]